MDHMSGGNNKTPAVMLESPEMSQKTNITRLEAQL